MDGLDGLDGLDAASLQDAGWLVRFAWGVNPGGMGCPGWGKWQEERVDIGT